MKGWFQIVEKVNWGRVWLVLIVSIIAWFGSCTIAGYLYGRQVNMTGSGTLADPFVIWDVNDLQDMNLGLIAYYELGQAIDASITSTWNGGLGFSPIGTHPSKFQGHFDGKGYTISNLYINRPAQDYIAVFGGLADTAAVPCCIKNVTFQNVNITGRHNVGVIFCYGNIMGNNPDSGVFSNCHASGRVTGSSDVGGLIGDLGDALPGADVSNCSSSVVVTSAGSYAGGLIARACCYYRIHDCQAIGNVTGAGESIGGFIGDCRAESLGGNPSIIEDCYATGTVTGTGVNMDDIGGFAGWYRGTTGWTGPIIRRCHASGNVIGAGDYVGGFVGKCGAASANPTVTITQCYATGNVTQTSRYYAGGFLGNGIYKTTITQCYATGNVSGRYTGGFAGGTGTGNIVSDCYALGSAQSGFVYWGSGTIERCYSIGTASNYGFNRSSAGTNCFWDTESSGRATSGGGTGKTTAEMKTLATFLAAGWDIALTTELDPTYGYPFLSWQLGSSPIWLIFLSRPLKEYPLVQQELLELLRR